MMMPMIANLTPLFILLRDMSLLNTLTALIIVGASAGQVFSIFVLRSFVADIPQDLFEAAEIDGASHFQQVRVIVLPLAAPIVGTVAVMQFIALVERFRPAADRDPRPHPPARHGGTAAAVGRVHQVLGPA